MTEASRDPVECDKQWAALSNASMLNKACLWTQAQRWVLIWYISLKFRDWLICLSNLLLHWHWSPSQFSRPLKSSYGDKPSSTFQPKLYIHTARCQQWLHVWGMASRPRVVPVGRDVRIQGASPGWHGPSARSFPCPLNHSPDGLGVRCVPLPHRNSSVRWVTKVRIYWVKKKTKKHRVRAEHPGHENKYLTELLKCHNHNCNSE